MVLNLTYFVLLACACVTINATWAPLQQACMKIRQGSTAGFKHYVRPIILPQGQADWQMPLPKCLGVMGGVDVMACDNNTIPSVKITDPSTVVVHRTGNLESYTVVHITLYCLSPQGQLSSGKIPPPTLKK